MMNYSSESGQFLPDVAYFCVTMLEYKFKVKYGKKARDEAAKACGIHVETFSRKLRNCQSNKGGEDSDERAVQDLTKSLTKQEETMV